MATATSELIVLAPVAEGRLYPVQSGERTYFVDAELGECDCPGYVWRCSRTRSACKHVAAVARHIEAALACPLCKGQGMLVPSGLIHYVFPHDGSPDMEPLPCLMCDGRGKR